MDAIRVKQTARKSTGGVFPEGFIQQGDPLMSTLLNDTSGKPPPSKSGSLSSPSTSRSANDSGHHHAQRSPGSLHKQSTVDEKRENPQGRAVGANSPSRQKGGVPSPHATAVPNYNVKDFMWSAPTSNIRGGEEEEWEEEAMPTSASSGPTTQKSTGSSMAKGNTPKCVRCSEIKSNPVCEPYPGSKKCAKCVRDHRNCSWTSVAVTTSSSESSASPKKAMVDHVDNARPGHQKKVSVKKASKLAEGPARQTDESASTASKSGQSRQIGPKCTRCASFVNSPVCERSDNPNDLKCKKCRRDKQSCSFAPFSRPPGKRKSETKTTAEGGEEESELSEEDENEEDELQDDVDDAKVEKEQELENKATQQKETEKMEQEQKQAAKKECPEGISTPRPVTTTEAIEEKKRKQRAELDNRDDESPAKKKIRPVGTSVSNGIGPSSTHKRSSSKRGSQPGTGGDSKMAQVPLQNGTGTAPAEPPMRMRIISIPQAPHQETNGAAHESAGASSAEPTASSQPPSRAQHIPAALPGRDRPLAVIEQELTTTERKASELRAIAESYLRDAEKADQEVTRLKEELIAAVRKGRRSIDIDGVILERRRLIELLASQQ